MRGNLVEGLCKEQPSWEQSRQCQIPSTRGWHCPVHLLLSWTERPTSIPSVTQSVCKARKDQQDLSETDKKQLRLLSDVFCHDFVSL